MTLSLVIDRALRVCTVESTVESILGLRAEQVEGRSIIDVIDANDRDRFGAFLGVSGSVDVGPRVAIRFVDATSRPVWMEVTVHDVAAGRMIVARPYVANVLTSDDGENVDDSNRFHSLVQNSADIVLVIDPDGTVRFANPAMLRTLGLSPEDLLGTQILEVMHPDDQSPVTAALVSVLENPGRSQRVEFRARHADGSLHWIDGWAQNLLDHPEVRGILGNGRDVTDRRNAEQALRASEERYRSLAASSPSGIFELDVAGRVTYANERWVEITDRDANYHGHVWDVIQTDDARLLRAMFEGESGLDGIDTRVRVDRADGQQRWVELRTQPMYDAAGAVDGHVGTLHDVTDVQQYQDELAHQALHDPLTGLPNRTMLLDKLESALHRAAAADENLALLFVDLDRFKVVNDSLGHHAGDRVLVHIAARLNELARPGDLVTRFGGDEFVVLCERVTGRADAMKFAKHVQREVGGVVDIGGSKVHISVSIGVILGSGTESPGDLLRDADAAMYEAKTRGRDQTQAFDDAMHRAAVSRLIVEQELRRGFERDEFALYFQPIIDLENGRIAGAEALLRWNHPERGLLEPAAFLGIAEESGLIRAMGRWVVEQACEEAVRWPKRTDGFAPRVFVNLAGRQLADLGLADEVEDVMSRTGIEPRQLFLEVTEGILMAGAGTAARVLRQLRELGVRIAIDDFGTGYSSLSYLTRLPVDLLKVDRSFVLGIGGRSGDYEVTAAIIALAHTLGLRAIAEGVETPAQLASLRKLSCDAAQGFLFSRPLMPDAFVAELERSGVPPTGFEPVLPA